MSHIYEVVLEVRSVTNYEDLRNLIVLLTNIKFVVCIASNAIPSYNNFI